MRTEIAFPRKTFAYFTISTCIFAFQLIKKSTESFITGIAHFKVFFGEIYGVQLHFITFKNFEPAAHFSGIKGSLEGE